MRLLTLRVVLAATDLEAGSVAALQTAARLARLAGAELHLLHVAASTTPGGSARLRDQIAQLIPGSPEPASIRIASGDPAAVIVEEAVRSESDAIVLGPHRRETTEMGPMGSTAATVVRSAPCPCLVAATELRLPIERVLVAIDTSEVAGGTLAVALSWTSALRPRWARAHIAALHVAPESAPPSIARTVQEEVERARRRGGAAAGVELRDRIVSGGEPAEVILREADADDADLVVLGTRDREPAAAGLGSVTAAVARVTPRPVLLVPPDVSVALGDR